MILTKNFPQLKYKIFFLTEHKNFNSSVDNLKRQYTHESRNTYFSSYLRRYLSI